MTSFPVAICRISCIKFKCNYLKKKKHSVNFFIAFQKGAWNVEGFGSKREYPSLIISKIIESERSAYLNV